MAKLKIQSSSSDGEVKEFSLPELIRTLYYHRIGLSIVFGLFALAGIVLSILPRDYEGTGALWVEPGETSSIAVSSLASSLSGQQNDIVASEVLALQSRILLLRVADQLNLVNNPAFWGKLPTWISMPSPADRTLKNAETRDKVYDKLTKILDIENDGKDEVIYIYAKTISPTLSAQIVNTLINDYLAYLLEMRYGANERASNWLIGQLGDLKGRIDKEQIELIQLQQKLGLIGINPNNGIYLAGQSMGDLLKASDAAKVERIVAEAKLRFLRDSDPNLIEGEISLLQQPGEMPSSQQSLLASLRAAQATAASQYARLQSQYGPNYPEVMQQKAELDQINKEVSDEQNRILNQAQLSFEAASANEKVTSRNVNQVEDEAFGAHDNMARFDLLAQDYNADRGLYRNLVEQLQAAGITSGLQAGDIDVVDLADVPGKPIILGPLIYLPSGVVLGLICGCFFALWLASLDHRIRGPEHVEKLTGIGLLAQLPHMKPQKVEGDDRQIGSPQVVASLRSHYSEAIQSLRASLLLSRPGSAPRVILVTSAAPNEGKSITAINLAATLARHGAKVLIADCDLRRGLIAKRLGVSATKGLSSVVTRQTSLESAVQECPGVRGLFVLPDGPRSPDPAVLIGSEEMGRLIETCRQTFDYVILDAPPMLGIADALGIAQKADAVIMVTRERVSSAKAVTETAAKMTSAHLPVVGFVYNDVDPRAARYGYGYYYRDYYDSYYTDREEVVEGKEV